MITSWTEESDDIISTKLIFLVAEALDKDMVGLERPP